MTKTYPCRSFQCWEGKNNTWFVNEYHHHDDGSTTKSKIFDGLSEDQARKIETHLMNCWAKIAEILK